MIDLKHLLKVQLLNTISFLRQIKQCLLVLQRTLEILRLLWILLELRQRIWVLQLRRLIMIS
nr:MAG TPA: hypothetical protein [Caudoviricetes sp.]